MSEGNNVFNQMLESYRRQWPLSGDNAKREVLQQIVLCGLARGGFFQKAAFYGGTCLRIFHKLPRFSEDMDFTLLCKDPNFRFEDYFPAILEECKLTGREVELTKKDKRNFGKVESAFLKDNTEVFNLSFQTEKSLRVKIEVDTMPPLGFSTEYKQLYLPYSFLVRCLTLPDLFAGKVNALLFRQWKTRVKGRDWYDFEWYVKNHIPLNMAHLQTRVEELDNEKISREDFMDLLKNKLSSTDIDAVKADVLPFVANPRELDIWSSDYFLRLADDIVFV